jgi:hypothetical protein
VLPSNRSGLAVEQLQDAREARSAVGLLEVLGERCYQLPVATSTQPARGRMAVVSAIAERFDHARRLLNHVTDHYVFPFREQWFPITPA